MPMILGGSGTINTSSSLAVAVAGVEDMRIDANGNVGIGNTNPTSKLVVEGSGQFRGITLSAAAGLDVGYVPGSNYSFITSGNRGAGTLSRLDFEGSSFKWFNGFGTTQRMDLDSSGRLTIPNQPTFHVGGGTAGGSGTLTQTSPTLIIWTVAVTNIGNHYNTSTGLFTAPVAGVYRFDYMLQQRYSGGFQVWWYRNGSAIYRSGYSGSVSNDDGPGMASSISISLAANDTFAVWGARVGGAADAYLGGSGSYDISYFSGRLLG